MNPTDPRATITGLLRDIAPEVDPTDLDPSADLIADTIVGEEKTDTAREATGNHDGNTNNQGDTTR